MEYIEYFRIILKRLWLIVLIVVISTIVTAWYSDDQYRPVYGATTKLIVSKSQSQDQLISTYKEIIKTPAIMDKVVQGYPDLQISSKKLINDVQINALSGTQVMSIFIRDYSYERAARIVNAVSDVFQSEIPKLIAADNIKVLNMADETERFPLPLNPKSNQTAVISFVVSLLFGIGIAFLLEFLDDTLKSESDIQQVFECSTLAMVVKTKEKRHQRGTNNNKSRKKIGEVVESSYTALSR
ncbi:YveK family protein [Cohnella luojiensis]|uniref:Lipopolysaccharide biosynthesis protein n=1 Tax=Cohnella luojiensis TaxID=652876 RepID=A0A4Y8LNQ2_9BACL|nr:Wzz/FepE/Etk N-terminal domain-containing protein [Cohnella luojiensis]TFE22634.1 lipopolysaccharide biosynthesis protein [Cohnella luojiensis]